ncbi:MOSC domain-containing protein [Tamlana sp. 2201CG12-4]|uniref:MOSC domain-containing protein n=1 Tax=Tamlana sp. 2201CG12-4 TaxID=3112582 RepID=UPI002DBAC182|nr:MOSC domain-containing protein [Tamlana sp. 2201CG12-4]MEC3907298.1 MOSC domain-containing protein [Tamlana sp. 2201CG12-4]
MHIISTNTAKPTIFTYNGQEVTTGIYKMPTDSPIFLGKKGVKDDEVTDKKVHGGEFKACYLFSMEQYSYWKPLYPNLKWNWGMFGENLTISGLDETQICIGDIYKVGETLIQITQPREPCFKFGAKFGDMGALKRFIDHGLSGTYVRILEEGLVKAGDIFELKHRKENSLTTAKLFKLIFSKNKDPELIKRAINNDALPQRKRDKLESFLKHV